jgi:hypothetical protein
MSYEIIEIGLLTAKIESTYGTDPVPTIGANAIPTVDKINFEIVSEAVPRKPMDGAVIMPVVGFNTMKHARMSFGYELRGNRTTGAVPDISSGSISNAIEIDCLLRACNLVAGYTAESAGGARDGSVTYTPKTFTDNTDPSVTLYFYTQGKLHKLIGARGTVKFRFAADKMAYADFVFTGFYTTPTDNTFPTQSNIIFLATKPPLFSNNFATLNAYQGRVQNIELDLGNDVQVRPDVSKVNGINSFLIVDRDTKGKIDPEADSIANWPIFADFESSTVRGLALRVGSLTGNMIELGATIEYKNIPYADRNKIRTHGIDFDVVRSDLSAAVTEASALFLVFK